MDIYLKKHKPIRLRWLNGNIFLYLQGLLFHPLDVGNHSLGALYYRACVLIALVAGSNIRTMDYKYIRVLTFFGHCATDLLIHHNVVIQAEFMACSLQRIHNFYWLTDYKSHEATNNELVPIVVKQIHLIKVLDYSNAFNKIQYWL